MSSLSKRNIVIIVGVLVLAGLSFGVSRGSKLELEDDVDVFFSEDELVSLGDSIEGLEFDDLGGLPDGGAGSLNGKRLTDDYVKLEMDDRYGLTWDANGKRWIGTIWLKARLDKVNQNHILLTPLDGGRD